MSTQMTILAIGPHTPALATRYEYPADWYADTPAGKQIATMIGEEVTTLTATLAVCEALGAKADDPASWVVKPDADLPPEAPAGMSERAYGALLDDFRAFKQAGFRFLLRIDR